MGRRNTRPKSLYRGLVAKSRSRRDSTEHYPARSDRLQPDKAILQGEVVSDQPIRRCAIDRLSWQRLSGLEMENGMPPIAKCALMSEKRGIVGRRSTMKQMRTVVQDLQYWSDSLSGARAGADLALWRLHWDWGDDGGCSA